MQAGTAATVLIVDDSEPQRLLVRTILEKQGYAITEATSGEEAVRQLSTRDFAVVLLDLNLPEGRGDMVVQWILMNRPQLQSRVVIVSADPESIPRDSLLSRLKIPFLAKPFRVRELLSAVGRIATV